MHKHFIAFFIVYTILFSITTQDQIKGVLILEEGTLQKYIDESQRLLVMFSEEDCEYCKEFSSVFVLVENLFAHTIKFIKINYSQKTKANFQNYKIHSTPTVLGFQKGKLLFRHYEPIQSGNNLSLYFFKWVQRLYEPLTQWAQQQQGANQLVVHCSNQKVKYFWQEISQSQLWLDIYCGEQQYLHNNLAIVHEFGKKVQAWQLQNLEIEEIQKKIQNLIIYYKFKHVVNWDSTIAHQIFVRNISAFVLLINNETRSAQIYQQFQLLKKKWYEKSLQYSPVMFVVSDLSKNTYQTIKLKRYLTGLQTSSMRYIYYYPILGFISRFENQGKFVMNLTKEKNAENVGQFIENMRRYIINNETQQSDNNSDIYVFVNEDLDADQEDFNQKVKRAQSNQTSKYQQYDQFNFKIIQIQTQDNWQVLFKSYQKPFFVYFTWRFDYKLQTLEHKLKSWWAQKDDQQFQKEKKYSQIFVQSIDEVDLPISIQIALEFIPTIYYFDMDRKQQKLQGVTDLNKIKSFVKNQLKSVIELKQKQQSDILANKKPDTIGNNQALSGTNKGQKVKSSQKTEKIEEDIN